MLIQDENFYSTFYKPEIMKKLLFVLFISLIYCLYCQSQEKTYLAKKHFISIGYGYKLDTKWWKEEIEKMNNPFVKLY